jgi:hypothetical protein
MSPRDKVYNEVLEHVLRLLSEPSFNMDMIASSLMVISQRLYKTHLSKKDYDNLMKIIVKSEHIKPYDIRKGTLH